MKKLIWSVFAAIVLFGTSAAHADVINANITADNNIYYWSGSSWTALGNTWEVSEPLSLTVSSPSDIRYFAVTNDLGTSGNPSGLLGSFTDATGTFTQTGTNSLLSNTASYWQVLAQPASLADPTVDPTTLAGWGPTTSYGANDNPSTIWNQNNGTINPIDPNAQWIWTANNNQNYNTEDDVAIFSVDLGVNSPLVTPEPMTIWLFLFAGVMVVLFNRKRLFI